MKLFRKFAMCVARQGSLAMLGVIACTGCAGLPKLDGNVSGLVVDAISGKPVSDVVVLVTWEGDVGVVDTQRRCLHAETAVTDAQGRFAVSPPPFGDSMRVSVDWRGAYAYKERYAFGEPVDTASGKATLALRPAPLDADRAFEQTAREFIRITHLKCGDGDGSNRNVYRMQARQFASLSKLANTSAQQDTLKLYGVFLRHDLVNFARPVHVVPGPAGIGGEQMNVDPADSFKVEEVLK